ncbi:MAG: DUF4007 family protein [Leptolyngbyaceae bacterium]|nr:DUF4007 family protein [Leptolyngbyaceae bacterium]
MAVIIWYGSADDQKYYSSEEWVMVQVQDKQATATSPSADSPRRSKKNRQDSESSSKVAPVFARHETFHPRFGWLKKGFDHAAEDSQVFLAENATVRLGVGKNMVRSIRYWMTAFKLLDNDEPTAFGQRLLGPDGWDTYLEDPASLWLLHWKLLEHTSESPCLASVWSYVFSEFRRNTFTQGEMEGELYDWRDRISPRTADSSIKKDVLCLLKMYVEQPVKRLTNEDSLDCPFTQLGLMHTAGDKRHFRFQVGPKATLPPAVVAYACLHHTERSVSGSTIPVSKLLYDPGSPGLVFKLTEGALCEALDQAGRLYGNVAIADGAGRLQFSFTGDAPELAQDILNQYYSQPNQPGTTGE